jgi:hypothetical protein
MRVGCFVGLIATALIPCACAFPPQYRLSEEAPVFAAKSEEAQIVLYLIDESRETRDAATILVEPDGPLLPLARSPYREFRYSVENRSAVLFRAPPGRLRISLLGWDGVLEYRADVMYITLAPGGEYYIRALSIVTLSRKFVPDFLDGALELVVADRVKRETSKLKVGGSYRCGTSLVSGIILCKPPGTYRQESPKGG